MHPPYLGGLSRPFQVVVSVAQSRAARWRNLRLSGQGLLEAARAEVAAWLVEGYPPRVLLKVWGSCTIPEGRAGVTVAKEILELARQG